MEEPEKEEEITMGNTNIAGKMMSEKRRRMME